MITKPREREQCKVKWWEHEQRKTRRERDSTRERGDKSMNAERESGQYRVNKENQGPWIQNVWIAARLASIKKKEREKTYRDVLFLFRISSFPDFVFSEFFFSEFIFFPIFIFPIFYVPDFYFPDFLTYSGQPWNSEDGWEIVVDEGIDELWVM